MNNVKQSPKASLTTIILLGAIFLVVIAALFLMMQAEMEKRVALERTVTELNNERVRLSKELEDAVISKKDLEVQLTEVEEKARVVADQLDEEKRMRESLFAQVEQQKGESKRLSAELAQLKDEKTRIESSLAGMKSECDNLKTKLYGIQQAKEIVESKLKEMLAKKDVELEKIVVTPDTDADSSASQPGAYELASSNESTETAALAATSTPAPVSDMKGEVMVVNKKFDFVIVNLGENNGLKVGTDLNLYRGSQFLAMLKVEKVHESMSAARIPSEWKNADIMEGDIVTVAK